MSILSAWLPQTLHDRAHVVLRGLLPQNTSSMFEPRLKIVVVFRQVLMHRHIHVRQCILSRPGKSRWPMDSFAPL